VLFDLTDAGPDYQLAWPRALFVDELRAIMARGGDAELLLEEAFVGESPRQDLRRLGWRELGLAAPGWTGGDDEAPDPGEFLRLLLKDAALLRQYRPPQPYWIDRHGERAIRTSASEPLRVRDEWTNLIDDLLNRGYLDKAAPGPCVDDQGAPEQGRLLNHALERRLTVDGVWPLHPQEWDNDTFYSLIEIFHDLIARPRSRHYHDFADCGFHYSDFAYQPGQRLYRWKVNALLNRHGIDLLLADSGEDVGRLVHAPTDPRQDLVEKTLTTTDQPSRDTVEHAVALYRARTANRESKRNACRALADVLEERRNLLKAELLSKDEGALFQIANQFAIRHRNAQQRAEYDDAYLDWLFWWYLGTVELTNRLLARPSNNDRT
jgi:hypothetical protein